MGFLATFASKCYVKRVGVGAAANCNRSLLSPAALGFPRGRTS